MISKVRLFMKFDLGVDPCAAMSLSTKSATRKPRIAVGKSFATIFHSAMRL